MLVLQYKTQHCCSTAQILTMTLNPSHFTASHLNVTACVKGVRNWAVSLIWRDCVQWSCQTLTPPASQQLIAAAAGPAGHARLACLLASKQLRQSW
jgi:hypothetical protein